MAERLKAVVLKTTDPKGSGGSNPSPSAAAWPFPAIRRESSRNCLPGFGRGWRASAYLLTRARLYGSFPTPVTVPTTLRDRRSITYTWPGSSENGSTAGPPLITA